VLKVTAELTVASTRDIVIVVGFSLLSVWWWFIGFGSQRLDYNAYIQ